MSKGDSDSRAAFTKLKISRLRRQRKRAILIWLPVAIALCLISLPFFLNPHNAEFHALYAGHGTISATWIYAVGVGGVFFAACALVFSLYKIVSSFVLMPKQQFETVDANVFDQEEKRQRNILHDSRLIEKYHDDSFQWVNASEGLGPRTIPLYCNKRIMTVVVLTFAIMMMLLVLPSLFVTKESPRKNETPSLSEIAIEDIKALVSSRNQDFSYERQGDRIVITLYHDSGRSNSFFLAHDGTTVHDVVEILKDL